MQRSRNHIAISRRNHLPYILFVLAEMWSDPDWFIVITWCSFDLGIPEWKGMLKSHSDVMYPKYWFLS